MMCHSILLRAFLAATISLALLARTSFAADPAARDFRWWHLAPHRLDFFVSPLREIVVLLLMLGVTAVCGLGAWMGLKKLARGGKLDGQPPD